MKCGYGEPGSKTHHTTLYEQKSVTPSIMPSSALAPDVQTSYIVRNTHCFIPLPEKPGTLIRHLEEEHTKPSALSVCLCLQARISAKRNALKRTESSESRRAEIKLNGGTHKTSCMIDLALYQPSRGVKKSQSTLHATAHTKNTQKKNKEYDVL